MSDAVAFRTRIRTVRPKSGGHIVVLDQPAPRGDLEVVGELSGAISRVRDAFPGDLAGFALVCWGTGGRIYRDFSHDTRLGPYVLESIPVLASTHLTDAIVNVKLSRG